MAEVRARAAERNNRRLMRDCVLFSIESLDWMTASEETRATIAAQMNRPSSDAEVQAASATLEVAKSANAAQTQGAKFKESRVNEETSRRAWS